MTDLTDTRPTTALGSTPALLRVGGGLLIAHVVLILAGLSQQRGTMLDADLDQVRRAYVDSDLTRVLAGAYLECIGFVLLIPALVVLARAVGRRSELGRWAAQVALCAGVGYVVVTLATGMPPLAIAQVWGHRDGADLQMLQMFAELRVMAYVASLLLLALQAGAVGLAAREDRFAPRWAGVGGFVVGALLLVGAGGAAYGLHDIAALAWMVWAVGLGVFLMRNASVAGDRRQP